MMIDIRDVYQFVTQTKRSGTSGYDSEDDWNANIKSTEIDIYRTLVPLYAKDDRIQKIFSPFVKTLDFPNISNGSIEVPEDFDKYIDTIFEDGSKIVYPRNLNEKSRILSSPIQNPTLNSDEYFCFFNGSKIDFLPQDVEECKLVYLRKPVPASISFQLHESDDEDYIRLNVIKNSEWPDEIFNLYCAVLLEKFGFQNRETIATEYGRLGIERNVNLTVQ